MGIKYPGLLIVFLLPAFISGASAAIYVENASAFDFSLNAAPVGLNSSLDGIEPRIFTEGVDSLLGKKLIITPSGLDSSLNALRPRIFIEDIDTILGPNLIDTPAELDSSIATVRPRIFTEDIDTIFRNNLVDTPSTIDSSLSQVMPRIFTEHLDYILKNDLSSTFVDLSTIESSFFIEDAPPGIVVNKALGDKTDIVVEIKNTGDTIQHVRVKLNYPLNYPTVYKNPPEIYSRNDYSDEEKLETSQYLSDIEIGPNTKKQIIWRFEFASLLPILSKVVFSEETFVSNRLVSVNKGTINVVGWSDGIIITNRKLLYKKFAAKETTTLLNKLYTIADGNDNKEKNNVVYYVDRYNESVVAKWNQSVDYTDPGSINMVAEEIDRLIEQKYNLLLYPKYLTIVGGDEIIPFYRYKLGDDESKESNSEEQDPLLKMYAYNYFPTEMKYSNVYSIPWEKNPDIATGRISSASSKDMTNFIKNSVNGPSNSNAAILVTDKIVYSTDVIKEKLEKKFVIKELSYIFSSDVSDNTKLYMKDDFKILSYAGHSNYNQFAYIKMCDFPEDNSISNNRPLITIGGCRAGLTTNDGLEWNPQPNDNNVWKLSNQGASAILASGSLARSSTIVLRGFGLAFSEQIYNNFYAYLFEKNYHMTEPIGNALVEAINNYDEWGDLMDTKARMQFILYSIPWMTFDPPITPQEQITNDYEIILTPPEKIDEGIYRRLVTIDITNYDLTSVEGFDLITIKGTSYILNDLKPILPKINTALNLPIGSEIENITIISENKIDLGNLYIPSFQSTNTNDPQNSGLTNTSDISGVFPPTRFITTNLTYQGYNKLKINLVPAQYNIDTNETFLFNTTVLEVIYKTTDNIIITDFLSVDTNFNINDIVSTNVTLENVGSQASENVHYEFVLKNPFGQIVKNHNSSEFNISVGIQQIEANISTQELRQGSYIAEINIFNTTGYMLANSSEYIYLISGRLTNFKINVSSIDQGEQLKFNFDFENFNNTDLMAYGQISIFDQQNNIIDEIRIPSVTVLGNSIKNFNRTWNSSNSYPGSYKAELTLSSEGSEFGAEDQWFRILNFYNLSFLPPLSSEMTYRLNSSSILPIRFTARDNQTGNFISDNSVNVSIINSTGSVIERFNITNGVQINSDEEQYEADFNTSNYPSLTTDEIYSVELRFGIVEDPQSYAIAYFTLVDNTLPNSVSNINFTNGSTWLNFTWTNPLDPDFSHVMLYLNGTFLTNVYSPQNYYNITGLLPNTSYELGTHTVDTSGNVNQTWVNKTARTAPIEGTQIVIFPGMNDPPTDPDGDGLYEDINGNGRKDFNDVVVFFNYLEWVASNEPISNFDFNGNGRIDFNDIIKLFEEL